MDWNDLENKHMREWGEFFKERDKSWNDMRKEHEAMREAFGNKKEEIPASVQARMERDDAKWRTEWSMNGQRATQLKESQRAEIDQLKKKEAFKARLQGKNPNGKDLDKDF